METASSKGVLPDGDGSLPRERPPGVRWGLGDSLAVFVGAQVLSAVSFGLALAIFGTSIVDDPTVPFLFVAQLGLTAGYGLGPILVSRWRGNGPVADYGAWARPSDVLWVAAGLFLQLVVLPLLYVPISALTDGDPSEASRRLIGMAGDLGDVGLLAIMVVLAAPVVEELFFRGLFLRSVALYMPGWAAVVVSALVFAVVHQQPLALPGLFVFGLAAGELTRRTGRLGPACWLHAGFNAVTLVVLVTPTIRGS